MDVCRLLANICQSPEVPLLNQRSRARLGARLHFRGLLGHRNPSMVLVARPSQHTWLHTIARYPVAVVLLDGSR